MTAAPPVLHDLIQRFGRNRDAYKSPTYNETQARREFIDPLFKALAWDVENEQGLAEAYKDVIHEDAIKVGGVTKAPDYCFRIGGVCPPGWARNPPLPRARGNIDALGRPDSAESW